MAVAVVTAHVSIPGGPDSGGPHPRRH